MKLIDQILMLPEDERLNLVNQILESISHDGKNYDIPQEVMNMVSERVERYRKNPQSAIPMDEFKVRLNKLLNRD